MPVVVRSDSEFYQYPARQETRPKVATIILVGSFLMETLAYSEFKRMSFEMVAMVEFQSILKMIHCEHVLLYL